MVLAADSEHIAGAAHRPLRVKIQAHELGQEEEEDPCAPSCWAEEHRRRTDPGRAELGRSCRSAVDSGAHVIHDATDLRMDSNDQFDGAPLRNRR